MTIEMPKPVIEVGETAPPLPGLLDVVQWTGSGQRAMNGAQIEPIDAVTLKGYSDGGSKDDTEFFPFRDVDIVITPYLRAKASTGAMSRAELRRRALAAYNAGLEDYVTREFLDQANIENLSPGGTVTTAEAVAVVAQAMSLTFQRPGFILVDPYAINELEEITAPDGTIRSGHRLISSTGVLNPSMALDEKPASATVFGFLAPVGTKTEPYVVDVDVDREDNTMRALVESTIVLGLRTDTEMFSCTTSS